MANEQVKEIVNGLSALIGSSLAAMEEESAHPSGNADRSDGDIDFYKKRAAALRKVRDDFENEMARTPQVVF